MWISQVFEVVSPSLGCEAVERLADAPPRCIDRKVSMEGSVAFLGSAPDWAERCSMGFASGVSKAAGRAVWPRAPDGLAHALDLVAGEIFQDDVVARRKGGGDHLLDIGPEDSAVQRRRRCRRLWPDDPGTLTTTGGFARVKLLVSRNDHANGPADPADLDVGPTRLMPRPCGKSSDCCQSTHEGGLC